MTTVSSRVLSYLNDPNVKAAIDELMIGSVVTRVVTLENGRVLTVRRTDTRSPQEARRHE